MNYRRPRTVSFSYPHSQIERQIDSFLETFKRRSAAAMERAQSLQGGPGGLVATTPETPIRHGAGLGSPRKASKISFHIPRRKVRWKWSPGVTRSRSGLSVGSSGSDSSSGSFEGLMHRSLPHSLGNWVDDSNEDVSGKFLHLFDGRAEAGCLLMFHFFLILEQMVIFPQHI